MTEEAKFELNFGKGADVSGFHYGQQNKNLIWLTGMSRKVSVSLSDLTFSEVIKLHFALLFFPGSSHP